MSADEEGSGTPKRITDKLFLFIHIFTNNLTSNNILVRKMIFDGDILWALELMYLGVAQRISGRRAAINREMGLI